MIKKVIKIGSSAGVTLSPNDLKRLGLKTGDKVEVAVSEKDGSITILPHRKVKSRREHIAKLTLDFADRYRKDLERLAKN